MPSKACHRPIYSRLSPGILVKSLFFASRHNFGTWNQDNDLGPSSSSIPWRLGALPAWNRGSLFAVGVDFDSWRLRVRFRQRLWCVAGSPPTRVFVRQQRCEWNYPGAAIAADKIIDPRTGSLQIAARRRDVRLEVCDAARGFCAFVNGDPDARLVDNFALTIVRSAAGPITQILGTGLRTNIFHVAEHAIAASLAAKKGRFDGKFESLHDVRKPRPLINDSKQANEKASQQSVLVDWKEPGHLIE